MTKTDTATVRVAIGVFSDAKNLQSAIDELQHAGFQHDELGIMASESVVKEQLGDVYQRTTEGPDPEKSPAIAFINRDSIGEAGEVMSGGLYFIGTSGLAGAMVASAALLGGALTAALGGILGVGLVGLAVGSMINQSDADEIQQRVDEGHILLFVRLAPGAQEQRAKDILDRYDSTEVKVHEIPIRDGEPLAAD